MLVAATALALAPAPALAQRTAENAVTSSDDAFGTQVGLESTGIYTENDTRGFSPLKAGNYRLDGIYFDPVAIVTPRLKTSTAIRVGHAALDYPFPAPTGVVDAKVKTLTGEWIASPAFTRRIEPSVDALVRQVRERTSPVRAADTTPPPPAPAGEVRP